MATSSRHPRSTKLLDPKESSSSVEERIPAQQTRAQRRPGSFSETVADDEFIDASDIWTILIDVLGVPEVGAFSVSGTRNPGAWHRADPYLRKDKSVAKTQEECVF